MRRLYLPLIATMAFAGCSGESTTPSAETSEFDLPADHVVRGLSQNLSTNGIRTAHLVSDSAYSYDVERRLDLMGVNVTFYDEVGAEAGNLTSETGDYNIDSGTFIARGDVVLLTDGPDGQRKLETEELYYETRVDSLYTTRPFTMTDNGRVSTGTSFNTNSKFTTWRVTGAQTQTTVEGESGLSF